MSRRGWVAVAVTFGVLIAGAAVGWAVWDADSEYQQELVKYDDHRGEPNRYVNLGDGEAQLSIGSPDRHRIVVQWRDPDGHGWTEPETVWTDDDNVAVDNTVRFGGGTVAILQTYTRDVHSDSDIDAFTVGIVCRNLGCEARRKPSFGGGEAQVTPDGSTVYLGQSEQGATLWTAADGIRLAPWSGHPGFDYHVVSPSRPVLAPDGSLRVVTSHRSRGSCTFELLTGAPGTADLTSAASTTERLRGRWASDCGSYLMTYSADWVATFPQDHRAPDFWFVREGDSWTTTRDDPSGLEIVDVDRGCCDSAVNGFVHWDDVAFGSPDGHRIQVQTHRLGDETWSDPTVLDGAPADYRCTWLDGYEVGEEGYAVLMTCHSGKIRNEFQGDAYAVAVTPDLDDWESTFVPDVGREPEIDDDRVTVGKTTWTAEDGFATE
jgi:hypothetical protein